MTEILQHMSSTMTSQARAATSPEPVTPTVFDVLCGTGIERLNQPGNELFSRTVVKYVDSYVKAISKREKMAISRAALDELYSKGVRFLKKHPVYHCWYVANMKVGRDRIGHFLRQYTPKSLRMEVARSHAPIILPQNPPFSVCSHAKVDSNGLKNSPAALLPITPSIHISDPFLANNVNIANSKGRLSLSSFCTKKKRDLWETGPRRHHMNKGDLSLLKLYPDKLDEFGPSLFDVQKYNQPASPEFTTSSFGQLFPTVDSGSNKASSMGGAERHQYTECCVHDFVEDLFDDAELAECLDWQVIK